VHRRFPGQMHGFFTLLVLPGAADALEYVGEQVDHHLATTTPLADNEA
jgi:acetyl esterase